MDRNMTSDPCEPAPRVLEAYNASQGFVDCILCGLSYSSIFSYVWSLFVLRDSAGAP